MKFEKTDLLDNDNKAIIAYYDIENPSIDLELANFNSEADADIVISIKDVQTLVNAFKNNNCSVKVLCDYDNNHYGLFTMCDDEILIEYHAGECVRIYIEKEVLIDYLKIILAK